MSNAHHTRIKALSGGRRRSGRGVTLFELLIALLLLSFGMFGMAKLQAKTLGMRHSSLYRSQATALTDDVLERMRADRAAAKAGAWDSALTTTAGTITGSGLSTNELREWKSSVESLLPSGAASVSVQAGVVTITVQWDDSRGRESAQAFVTKSQL